MRNLILSTLVLLLTANLFAQKTKIIINPYYEFSKTGIFSISKIEIDAKETRVYMYNHFLPNWWVNFDEEEVLTDCETQKEYKIRKIVGAKFEEKIFMPASGDSTIILVFPPLDKKVKRINYNNSLFGISLDENLAGKKPNYSVPSEINAWLNKKIAQSTEKPLEDYKSNDFFKEGKAKIVGYIKGYSRNSELKTGMMYLSNYLTREDYPMVVEIQEDGRFEVDIPLISPIYSSINMEGRYIPFYLEQGQTLGIVLDWEEFLIADRLRDRRYKFTRTQFKGSLAKINTNLLNYNFEETSYRKIKKLQEKMTVDQKVNFYDEQKNMELSKLDLYVKMKGISRKKTYQILKNKILLNHGTNLFDIARRRGYESRKDTSNKELQKPLSDSYYNFLNTIPLGEQALFINSRFKTFVNRYEFSSFISKQKEKLYKDNPLKTSFLKYLLENENLLSKEDKAYAELADKKDKNDEDNKKIKDMKVEFRTLKDRYIDSYSKWIKIAMAHNNLISNKIWDLAYQELFEKYGIKNNLTLDVAKVRSLNYKFKNSDKESAQTIWSDLKKGINHDYLVYTGDQLFNKHFSDTNNQAYELPEGTATDIFNKIIAPHKGKILFVDFWATSCGPCVGGIKRMKETRKEYEGDKDIDFVFITDERGSPEERYNKLVKEQELKNTYRITADEYLYLRQLFKFNGIPRYVVIDKNGKVINNDFSMYQFKSELAKIMESINKDLTKK